MHYKLDLVIEINDETYSEHYVALLAQDIQQIITRRIGELCHVEAFQIASVEDHDFKHCENVHRVEGELKCIGKEMESDEVWFETGLTYTPKSG